MSGRQLRRRRVTLRAAFQVALGGSDIPRSQLNAEGLEFMGLMESFQRHYDQ